MPPAGSKDNISLRKHLEQVERATKKKPKELQNLPPLPEVLSHLWQWFCEINSGEPLTYTEIANWSNLTQRNLTGFEVGVMRELDRLYQQAVNERRSAALNRG